MSLTDLSKIETPIIQIIDMNGYVIYNHQFYAKYKADMSKRYLDEQDT